MKKIILTLSVLALTLSCEQKKETQETTSLTESVSKVQDMATAAENSTQRIEELKKMPLASNEGLKAVFPETLLGLARTSFKVGDDAMMKVASGEAKYGTENKEITVEITDGAGEMGSGLFALLKMGLAATEEKNTPEGVEKITEIDNRRVSIKDSTTPEETDSEITFIEKDRYMIKIEGEGFTSQQLLEAAKNLNFSELK